jgi:hypothetical protein
MEVVGMATAQLEQVFLKARQDVKFYVRQAGSQKKPNATEAPPAVSRSAEKARLSTILRALHRGSHHEHGARSLELFLSYGIDAFRWLSKADTLIRDAVYSGYLEFDPDLDSAIESLYRRWLRPCDFAEHWIAKLDKQGYKAGNLEEFRKCCEEVRSIVGFLDSGDSEEASPKLEELRDEAVVAYRRGDYGEFDFLEPSGVEGEE